MCMSYGHHNANMIFCVLKNTVTLLNVFRFNFMSSNQTKLLPDVGAESHGLIFWDFLVWFDCIKNNDISSPFPTTSDMEVSQFWFLAEHVYHFVPARMKKCLNGLPPATYHPFRPKGLAACSGASFLVCYMIARVRKADAMGGVYRLIFRVLGTMRINIDRYRHP
jgi:hypothetical protein